MVRVFSLSVAENRFYHLLKTHFGGEGGQKGKIIIFVDDAAADNADLKPVVIDHTLQSRPP